MNPGFKMETDMQMILNIVGVKIRLLSNTKQIIEFIRGFEHILDIYYQELPNSSTFDCTLTYYNEHTENPRIIIDDDDVVFIAKWGLVHRSTAVRTLLVLTAERFRQRHLTQLTLHASAVSYGNKGYVFTGGQGAGKTTISMALSIGADFNYIANEHTVVGVNDCGISVFGASGPISLRYESLTMSFPKIAKNIFKKNPDDIWNGKKRVSPEILGMKTETHPVELDKIFIVNLNKSGNNYVKQIVDPYKINAFLYEESTRIIKGNALPIYTPDGKIDTYCPSFDTVDANNQRLRVINELQDKLFILSGTLEYCFKYIKDIQNNEG